MTTAQEAQDRLLDVLEALRRTTPGTADQETQGDTARQGEELLEALSSLHALRDALAVWEPQLIAAARDRGVSWHRLAPVLGVTSRQAAERRYLRLRPTTDGTLTREQRVQAARDERAGDRAVAAWADDNADELRMLASQLSSLTGLSARGRRQVAELRSLLFDGEPADLLGPLEGMHPHLGEHAGLAERVSAVGLKVTRVRARTQRERDAG